MTNFSFIDFLILIGVIIVLKDFIDTLLKNGLLKKRVNNKIKKLGENHKNEINSLLVDFKEYGVTISNLTKEIKSLHDTVEEVTCAYNDQTSKFNNFIEQTIQFNCQIFYCHYYSPILFWFLLYTFSLRIGCQLLLYNINNILSCIYSLQEHLKSPEAYQYLAEELVTDKYFNIMFETLI